MTPDDEEKFLLEQYESARFALEQAVTEASIATANKRVAEKRLEDAKQACVDYIEGNGLVEGDYFSLSETRSVDVIDIATVPEKYIREKIVREVNKALVKAEGLTPEGNNWLQYTIGKKINIKKEK